MKLKAFEIDKYINEQISSLNSALLYGEDEGLVMIRRNIIIEKILGKNHDPFLLTKIDADQLKKDDALLVTSINSSSLIPGRMLILVTGATSSHSKYISEAIEKNRGDNFLLVTSDSLQTSSSLRKFFEANKETVALPCYIDSKEGIIRIIREELLDYQIEPETINYLSAHLQGNRSLIKNEIKKIKIFCGENKQINHIDILQLVCTNDNADFQKLSNSIMDRNSLVALSLLEELLAQGFPHITLIRVLINYLERIAEIHSNIANGLSFFDASKKLRPPVFFTQKDILARHCNNWKPASISLILEKLFYLEKQIKSNSMVDGNLLLKSFILFISK